MRTKPNSQLPDATGARTNLRLCCRRRLTLASRGTYPSRHVTSVHEGGDIRCSRYPHHLSNDLSAFGAVPTLHAVKLRERTPVTADAANRGASP
jgi:hypothetical protein